MVNFAMWMKALRVIPRLSKSEWQRLDVISRWLVSVRAAVLLMTFFSAAIAGLLVLRDGVFHPGRWLLLVIGLVFAHAANNLVNDWTDHRRGVDRDNYFRTQYGPQPLEQGLMTSREWAAYAAATGLIAVAAGLPLVLDRGWPAVLLMALGAVFVLFYTWPLKYIGLGEVAVVLIWGPLMIAGGYYVISGLWDWNVAVASLTYAFGPTTVLFGKHIDKLEADKAKGIHTMPVILGEQASRVAIGAMIALQYLLVIYLVVTGFFSPVMLVVLLAAVTWPRVWQGLQRPKPAERPEGYDPNVWPLWFSALAFYHNRAYGLWLIIGLIGECLLRTLT